MGNEFDVNEGEGTMVLTEEGIKKVEDFKKKDTEMFILINAYVLSGFLDLAKEELDEKDYNIFSEILNRLGLGV